GTGANGCGQPARDGAQQRIAGGMPETVVDMLETVEIETHDANRSPVPRPKRERVLNAISKKRAVCKFCKRVVKRSLLQFTFERVAFGDVLNRAQYGRTFTEVEPVGRNIDFDRAAIPAHVSPGATFVDDAD